MEFVPIALLGALVYKFIDFLKYVRIGDWNAAGTQVAAWLAGVVAVLLFAQTNFESEVAFGQQGLGSMNFASQLVLGLSATSLFSAFYDLKSSLDRTDSAKTPALLTDMPPRHALRRDK